jgi:SAM-dependent methyltransferase
MKVSKFNEYEKRAYSTVYTEGDETFHDSIIKEFAEKFLPELKIPKKAVILDIGCGPGIFMDAAKNLGYKNLLGVTLSKEDHAACKKKGFKTLNSSMSDLNQKDGTVDFIWCRHAIEHSPYPLFTLYEFHRVLKDSALVYIEVPAPDNARLFMHEFNPNHYSILGDRMWQGLFEKAGFAVVNSFTYDVDVSVESGKHQEKNLIYILQRSQEDVAKIFAEKYGLKVEN